MVDGFWVLCRDGDDLIIYDVSTPSDHPQLIYRYISFSEAFTVIIQLWIALFGSDLKIFDISILLPGLIKSFSMNIQGIY